MHINQQRRLIFGCLTLLAAGMLINGALYGSDAMMALWGMIVAGIGIYLAARFIQVILLNRKTPPASEDTGGEV